MKKIDNCENSTVLVALLLAGILLVMGAYRLFSWLCSRGLTDTLTWVLGAAALVLAALGLLLIALGGRCPHCGKILFFLPANANQCPKCHGPL